MGTRAEGTAAATKVLGLAIALALATQARAKVFLTQDAALALAFGDGALTERSSVILSEPQRARAAELAGADVEVPSSLITRFTGRRDGKVLGWAYFDTHVVRTLAETLMIVVDPDGTIARLEVVAFAEPEDYLPKRRWYEQFRGRRLDRELSTRRGVQGVTGATLSSQAATDAARRVLAVHQALTEKAEAPR